MLLVAYTLYSYMAKRAKDFESLNVLKAKQVRLRFEQKQCKVWEMQVVSHVILEISRKLESDS